MYEIIKRLYETRNITETGVKNAVSKNWITQKECDEILKIKK